MSVERPISQTETQIRRMNAPSHALVDGMLQIATGSNRDMQTLYINNRDELIAYGNALRKVAEGAPPNSPHSVLREIRKAHTLREYRELKPLFKIVRATFRQPTSNLSRGGAIYRRRQISANRA